MVALLGFMPPCCTCSCIRQQSLESVKGSPAKQAASKKAGKANVAMSKQDRAAKAATVLAGETIPAMAEARDLALELIDDPDELAKGEEEVEK